MNAKQLGLLLVLADFAGLEAYAVWQYGYVGVFQLVLANAATVVAFADLCIALGLVMLWMWGDARERGISILLTDHNVRETLSVTDRSYIIADGKILRHGAPAELVSDEVVRRTYLGEGFTMPELTERP